MWGRPLQNQEDSKHNSHQTAEALASHSQKQWKNAGPPPSRPRGQQAQEPSNSRDAGQPLTEAVEECGTAPVKTNSTVGTGTIKQESHWPATHRRNGRMRGRPLQNQEDRRHSSHQTAEALASHSQKQWKNAGPPPSKPRGQQAQEPSNSRGIGQPLTNAVEECGAAPFKNKGTTRT